MSASPPPPTTGGTSSSKTYQLGAENELRFEVDPDAVLTITLNSGVAEIFGIELALKKTYHFTDCKLAVFTWYGASIEASTSQNVYVSEETPMVAYVNTHAQLEARRDVALREEKYGPRVMVAGPVDSGKTSLCSILLSYAIRLGRCPIYVDLDVGQGTVTIPGSLAALPTDSSTLTVEEGFNQTASLAYFYGHDNLAKNPELFEHYVGELGKHIQERLDNDKEARASGLVVNTAGWIEGLGFQLLLRAIQALQIDVILVMAHDKLYAELRSSLPDTLTIVKLPRSGGVVQRAATYRRHCRSRRIRSYFYGIPPAGEGGPGPFSPSALEVSFDDVTIFKVGETQQAKTLLPLGVDAKADPRRLTVVEPSQSMLHSILAVVHPSSTMSEEDLSKPAGGGANDGDQELDPELGNANVAGYLHVTNVDTERRRISLLSPCPGALPSRYLLLGSVMWAEGT